jgi:hypothetical protein
VGRAHAAGGATPDFIQFNLRQAECCLPDDLADAEGPHPVPGTDNVALPALVAVLEGLTAGLVDLVDDLG